MAFIRPYKASDEDEIIHIFRETASSDLVEAGDPALDYASYNWARPYIMLVPSHCLVIDDGHGRAVGYLLGVPDTKAFVQEYKERFLPSLTAKGFQPPPKQEDGAKEDLAVTMQQYTWTPENMLQQEFPDLLEQYPAHLHIDILSSHQGQGWGRKLIEQTIDSFRSMGVKGIHLGKHESNFEAAKFYAKLNFDRYPVVMDGGESGQVGKVKDGGFYLVRACA